jgi:hypothetical protein
VYLSILARFINESFQNSQRISRLSFYSVIKELY